MELFSKSSGTDIVLDANKMSKYFFKTPSKVNTFWYEIGMRFYDKSDNNYYPMYSGRIIQIIRIEHTMI
ncbi:hypothetical protein AVM71_17655 (plasmid) [Piscirickettsia salmonis]|nr:hypothetical protein AVM71_17655 [Piscirickettsia salmonis]